MTAAAPDTRAEWVSRLAAGRTFAEVGGLWGTIYEQVTVAGRAGAVATTMIDMTAQEGDGAYLWELFRQRVDAAGLPEPACLTANVDDHATPERVGSFEIVHCSGVLYHCPVPLHTLRQLRQITTDTLILGTVTLPAEITTASGRVPTEPGEALRVAELDAVQRAVISDWLREEGATAVGISDPLPGGWAPEDYARWWWLFTPEHVALLLAMAGFEVRRSAPTWNGHATIFEAAAVGPAALGHGTAGVGRAGVPWRRRPRRAG